MLRTILLFALFLLQLNAFADGYEIDLKIKGLENTQVYFAYHYGEKQYIRDSLVLDQKAMGTLKGAKELGRGLYIVILPDNKYFEMIGNEQKFSMETDTTNIIGNMKVKGSKENKLMYADLKYLSEQKNKIAAFDKLIDSDTTSGSEKVKFAEEREAIVDAIDIYRKDWAASNSDSFYAKLIAANEEPQIPDPPSELEEEELQRYRFNYFHDHFFDNVDFTESGLSRSPALFDKYEQYLNTLTVSNPDSLINAGDYIARKAEGHPDIYKYTLSYLLNKFAQMKYMGHDAVYVHIADEYYKTGKAHWVDSTALYRINASANDMRGCLIGQTGRNIILKDRNDEFQNVYELPGKYKVLFFWDPDCGHCKKMAPKLADAYPTLKEKYDAEVIGIATEHEKDKWLAYLDENNPPWINVADFEFKNNFRRWYNIQGTPRIFILDENNVIIAKRIAADQVLGFMEHYVLQQANSKETEEKKK